MKKLFLLATFAVLLCSLASHASAKTPPNIIVIMADDMGYGDLGCYGHPSIRTPNLDRMAAEGLRFTDFYAGQSLCTPSRAALLTGRLPIRSGMAGGPGRHVLYPQNPGGLPASEITIAEALKTKGYATAAIGKWHIGDLPDYLPTTQGFDYFFGLPYSNDSDWVKTKYRKSETLSRDPLPGAFNVPLMRGTNIIQRPADQAHLTQRYTEEAIGFMEKNKNQPFFVYFAQTFPHVPLFASEKFKGKSPRGRFGDAVEEVDWSVGEVLKWLRKENLEKNTLVIFTSDNGPWLTKKWNGGSGGLLRDGKGGTWDGGYRVPAIARWPGKIPAGVTHEIASAMDLFTTSLKLAGVDLPKDRVIDGVDLTPLLFGGKKGNRDVQYFYYGDQLYALREGKYKANFITHDGYSKVPAEEHQPPLLFDVAADPSEKFDIAAEHPDVVAEILKIAAEHQAKMVPGKLQF